MTFLVLQDIKYTGGPARVAVRLPAGEYAAADLHTGQSIDATWRDGVLLLDATLPPNGAALVAIRRLP